jgi:two-component system nitrate/nitrite response regulator NarL
MRTIVVDDHVLFRQGLVSLLHSEPDFDVVGEAGSNKEALQLVRTLKPDLILLDFELPDGTGAEATREILKEHPHCKIVLLTVHAEDEKLIESVRSGAVGYLLKSRPITDLLASLRSVGKGEAAISRTMTRRILEEMASPGVDHSGQKDPFASLTHRENEVLRELMDGLSNREIASKLFINENTVKHHIHSIFGKLGIKNRKAAAEYARKHGLK